MRFAAIVLAAAAVCALVAGIALIIRGVDPIPIVAALCVVSLGAAAVVLLWGAFDAVLISGIPAIVAAVVTLLILALPPIRGRLED